MITYSQYLSECNGSEEFLSWGGTRRKNKEPRPLKEKRFNRIRDTMQFEIENGGYKTREEAEAALELKVQQMGLIELFIFRAVIGWIVHKLLDAWFNR